MPDTDEAILREVLENWHPDKLSIPKSKWIETLEWMRREGYKTIRIWKRDKIAIASRVTAQMISFGVAIHKRIFGWKITAESTVQTGKMPRTNPVFRVKTSAEFK